MPGPPPPGPIWTSTASVIAGDCAAAGSVRPSTSANAPSAPIVLIACLLWSSRLRGPSCPARSPTCGGRVKNVCAECKVVRRFSASEREYRALDYGLVLDGRKGRGRPGRVEIGKVIGGRDAARPLPRMAEASPARRGNVHHETEPIPRRPPRPPLHRSAEGIGGAHGGEELAGHEPPDHQSMQEQRSFGRGAHGEAVIDPARMIAHGISPGRAVQIARLTGDLHVGHAEGLEDEPAKGGADLFPGHLLDETAHEEVADIRICPAVAG